MPVAPLHPHEARRLLAVQRSRMLGTPAEERFDRITRIAKRIFGVPIVIIDVVAENEVFAKSEQGMRDFIAGPRNESYCQYTILGEDACLIPDALLDARLADNPHASTIRFYAGQPIRFEESNIGALCVCDYEPREFTTADLAVLRDLALMVEHEMAVSRLSEAQLEVAKAYEELETKALVDSLTRVWNRGAILDVAAREIAAGTKPIGLALVDIDHFKKVNDTFMHQAGDEVLRRVADRLRRSIREFDAIGRYGGEEFLMVFTGIQPKDLESALERVRKSVCSTPIELNEQVQITVTVSIGATVSSESGFFTESLVGTADRALYAAKDAGRNQVVIYPR